MTTENQYEMLVNLANEASRAYYNKHESIMTDDEYDALIRMILQVEISHGYSSDYSPTLRVGSDLDTSFNKVKHDTPILSLPNARTEADLLAWEKRWTGRVTPNKQKNLYIVQPKYDGLTIVLKYKDGKLFQALTRGDGEYGDDITENARTIRSIPLKIDIPDSFAGSEIVVRGEVLVKKHDFVQYNAANGNEYSNPRNFASGSIKQKKSSEVANRPLTCYVYDILLINGDYPYEYGYSTLEMQTTFMREAGFNIGPVWYSKDINEVYKVCESTLKVRDKLDFEIDGMVVKVNDSFNFYDAGFSGKDPIAATAYKFPSESGFAVLESVDWTIGKTGMIIPTANISSVEINGVTIRRVALHNLKFVIDNQLHIEDTLVIERSGDVIPYMKAVRYELRPDGAKPVQHPSSCPFCGTATEYDGTRLWCTNVVCPERRKRLVEAWVGKGYMDIKGLGTEIVTHLTSEGIVTDVADLYSLDLQTLQDMFGDKTGQNIIDGLTQSKSADWVDTFGALGIDGVGRTAARLITDKYPSAKSMLTATEDSLQQIPGIGPATAEKAIQWFRLKSNWQLLERLESVGFNLEQPTTVRDDNLPLSGITFCVTGTLQRPRAEIISEIETMGATFHKSVKKNTDVLIAGDNAGSKVAKAEKYNIPVISESNISKIKSIVKKQV